MTQLISDAQAAGMTGPDVRWDLQNEPDVGLFWNAPQSQWLEMWKRGYQMVRAAIPNALMEGPSNASGVGGQLFNAFLDYVKANNVVPDTSAGTAVTRPTTSRPSSQSSQVVASTSPTLTTTSTEPLTSKTLAIRLGTSHD